MMGYEDARIDSFQVVKTYKGISYNQMQYNVIASLGAGTTSDSVCIIGGHFDNILGSGDPFTFVPGANDNASGVAAAIEIARVMKKNNYVPASEILFIAFSAEELGLYGSKDYASDAKQTFQKIRLMLNNDMIAYEPSPDKTYWMVNIMDYSNSQYLRKEAEGLCLKYTLLKPYNDNTSNADSDSYSFFLYGYKAIFFISRLMDPTYHTIRDVATNCNFEYCREIVKLNCAILINKN
jgi:Zn-dependent M28 family amino/carboxypeptidase